MVSSASVTNLNDVDFDLAIRMFRPQVSTLVARRIGSARMGLFASRQFLADRTPDSIDLANEPLLMVTPRYGSIAETRWTEDNALSGQVPALQFKQSGFVARRPKRGWNCNGCCVSGTWVFRSCRNSLRARSAARILDGGASRYASIRRDSYYKQWIARAISTALNQS